VALRTGLAPGSRPGRDGGELVDDGQQSEGLLSRKPFGRSIADGGLAELDVELLEEVLRTQCQVG
jgi:hypothetical protein